MKQNVNKFAKRNKLIAIIVAILLACCITVSGIMLFRGQKSSSADAATPNTTVTIVTKDAEGNATTSFKPGDTVYFSVTISSTRTGVNWSALACTIAPVKNGGTDTDLLKYLSFPQEFIDNGFEPSVETMTNFKLTTYSVDVGTGKLSTAGVPLAMSLSKYTGLTNSTKSITYDFPLVISEDFTGSEMSFGMSNSASNKACFIVGSDAGTQSANTDNMEVGTLACTPVKLTIGDDDDDDPKDNDTSINPTATSGGKSISLTPTSGGFTGSVDNIDGTVTINVNPKSPTTKVTSGGGTIDLSGVPKNPDGSKTVSVTVEADDGSTETYTFTFSKPKDSKFDITVTASATGATSATWTTPGSYTYTVPYSTTSATLSASATSPITVASGSQTGTKTNLSVGNNGPYKIWGVAEDDTNKDGATAFSITIVRQQQPTDNTFNMTVTASANGSTLNTWSTPGSYTVTVPYDTTSVDLSAVAQSPASVAAGSQIGTKTLSVGDNGPYKIWAVAKDDTNKDGASAFNITIKRLPKPADNTFNMTVTASANGSTLNTWSTPGTYTVTVPYDTTSVDLSAVAQSPASVAAGSEVGTKTGLNVGTNGPYKIWAVAEDDTNKDGASAFYIYIEKRAPAETAPLLSQILINNYDDGDGNNYLVKDFQPDNMGVYKVYVPSDATHPRITAIASNENAKISIKVNGTGKDDNTGRATDVAALKEIGSSATVEITVSLDGKSSTYTLTVIRASETPYLTYLTVGTYQIFDGNKKPVNGKNEDAVRDVPEFFVTIENADTTVAITAKASAEDAEVKINGTVVGNGGGVLNASIGSLPFKGTTARVQISIYPQFGEAVVHYLNITRKPALSSNTNAKITIDEITTDYNPTIFNTEYAADDSKLFYGTYHVPYKVAVLTVTVTVEDLGELVAPATYEIYYDKNIQTDTAGKEYGEVRLAYGCNHVRINVIASDGTLRPIVVSVIREKPSLYPNPTIAEIKEFTNEYSADITNYKYVVAHNITKLTISVGYDRDLYDCVISGADNLKTGLNTVTISLIENNKGISRTAASAENKDAARTITIDVYRESNNASTIWLILFILFLLLAIIEAIIVAVLMMRRRNEPTTQRVVVAAASAPAPAPAPVVRMQPPVQYIPAPQPQVQYVQVPAPQPVEVEKPQQPVNVEVKITGCGDSDGYYKTKK